jgi:hypothetical protein
MYFYLSHRSHRLCCAKDAAEHEHLIQGQRVEEVGVDEVEEHCHAEKADQRGSDPIEGDDPKILEEVSFPQTVPR